MFFIRGFVQVSLYISLYITNNNNSKKFCARFKVGFVQVMLKYTIFLVSFHDYKIDFDQEKTREDAQK